MINANQYWSLLHTDSVEDDFELSTVCHRPESMDKLQEQTKFTKKELQVLYRGFKNVGVVAEQSEKGWETNKQSGYNYYITSHYHSGWQEPKLLPGPLFVLCQIGTNEFSHLSYKPQECPSGVVNEENFKTIYSQFFPQGGKSFSVTKAEKLKLYPFIHIILSILSQVVNFRQKWIQPNLFNSVAIHMEPFHRQKEINLINSL